MKLSVIIPVYNAESHIIDCLESVIDNNRKNWYEIILIDDGSTDDSLRICLDYSEKYDFISLISSENVGAAAARNCGLEKAKGMYITFIDSDDYVGDGYIKRCLEVIDSNLDSDIICFSYSIDYTQTGVSSIIKLPDYIGAASKDAVCSLDSVGALNALWNKAYKRSVIDQKPKTSFIVNSEPGEDLIFNVECFIKAQKVSLFSDCYYHWMRRGEDTLANKFRESLYEKNLGFIEYRNLLYTDLGIDKTEISLLAKGNINYVFTCIPNMYRVGKRFSRKKRVLFYREILGSKDIELWINSLDEKTVLISQFAILYKTKSPLIMDAYYAVVMGFRNLLGRKWNKVRNKLR